MTFYIARMSNEFEKFNETSNPINYFDLIAYETALPRQDIKSFIHKDNDCL